MGVKTVYYPSGVPAGKNFAGTGLGGVTVNEKGVAVDAAGNPVTLTGPNKTQETQSNPLLNFGIPANFSSQQAQDLLQNYGVTFGSSFPSVTPSPGANVDIYSTYQDWLDKNPGASQEDKLNKLFLEISVAPTAYASYFANLLGQEQPSYQLAPYEQIPGEALPTYKSLSDSISQFGQMSDSSYVPGANLERVEFKPAMNFADALDMVRNDPGFQAAKAKAKEEKVRRTMDILSSQGMLNSGTAKDAILKTEEDVDLYYDNLAFSRAAQEQQFSQQERTREESLMVDQNLSQALLGEKKATREQQAIETRDKMLANLGMTDQQLENAFVQDYTGILRQDFLRFEDYLQRVANLPLENQRIHLEQVSNGYNLLLAALQGTSAQVSSAASGLGTQRLTQDQIEANQKLAEQQNTQNMISNLVGSILKLPSFIKSIQEL